jgi:dTDP-4-amino-4,6-dideoxygalactose transaminase
LDGVKILFNDLKAQHASIKNQLEDAMQNALQAFNFIKGNEVKTFELAFADTIKTKHCISTGSGTDALFTILKALGIKEGDEVITPAFSWISSAEVITLCGAKPVFADVDNQFYTISLESIRQRITARTKAIIAVHLYGQATDMVELSAFCKQHKLWLIEDCAQAHLTAQQNKFTGTFGDAAAFSFYPTKNLGAYGDAGCIVTDHDELAYVTRRFANHGALDKDDHSIEGMNSRMDTLQAAVLGAKLPYLNEWNSKRINNANLYKKNLSGLPEIILPEVRLQTKHTFHLFVIRALQRDKLKDHLLKEGIQTIVHYPKALHNLPAYQYLNYSPEDFPVSNLLQEEVLSLPVHPALKDEEIDYVSIKIKEFYNK